MESVFDSDAFNASCFFPRADAGPPPEGARDLRVAVEGASLHLRWHEGAVGGPTVLFFHGNHEVVRDYDAWAEEFAALRLNLAVCDYRGYGESTGRPTFRSMLADAPVVLEAVAAQTASPVVVMGRSLGSACALELFRRDHPRVAGVVLESGFLELAGLVRRRGIEPPARFSEEELADFDGRRKVAQGRAPLLIVHGEKDRAISVHEAKEAFRRASTAQKRLVIIPGRGHNDLSAAPEYWAAIGSVWSWPSLLGW